MFALEFLAFAGSGLAKGLVKLAATLSFVAAAALAYVSLYLMQDVCLVCCSMYIIAIVMTYEAWRPRVAKAPKAKGN